RAPPAPDEEVQIDQWDDERESKEDEAPTEREDGAADERLLLDRLFARGLLPRYAFPTDVVSFHVFDPEGDRWSWPKLRYSPQQSLIAALSQYAPGREVWVDGARWLCLGIWDRYKQRYKRFK